MAKNQRVFKGSATVDPSAIANLTYNQYSGAQKNTEVGRHLIPLKVSGGYTTDATTRVSLGDKGHNLAIYNKSTTTLYAVTVGDSTVTALTSGAVSGSFVGIPCQPGTWTYVACDGENYVITENNNLLVFLIDDDTYIRQEASR